MLPGSHQLPVTSYQSPVTSHQSPVKTGNGEQCDSFARN
ncbi:hypothetical protein CKA32_001856 [Geitlerinema sp. FC II]|nr:hypothetical protein CKA32_001856 [Geitlerinema sp. FC II]